MEQEYILPKREQQLITYCSCTFYSDGKNVGDVLAPGQKWHNYDTGAVLEIEKINKVNSTIAGTYGLTRDPPPTPQFPFRGEFDPNGITVGWVVSYWNDNINYHSVGAWAGYLKYSPDLESGKYVLSMSRIIAHQSDENTTSGYGTFVWESN